MRRCEAALRRRRVRLRGTEREEGKEGADEAPHRKEKLWGWLNSTRRLRNSGAASDSKLDSAPMVAALGLGFVRVERRPRIWGTEGRRRLLFIGRMRSASTCGSRPGDAACGHKTRARTRVRLEEGGETGLVRVRRGHRRFSACGPSLDGGPRAAAELGAGPRAVARRGRRRKTGLTGGPRLAVEERALEMGWRARGLLGCGAWLGRREGGKKGKKGEERLGRTGVLG